MARLALFPVVVLLAAGCIAAAVVLGGTSSQADDLSIEASPGDAVAVRTSVTPEAHRFGDVVAARVEITVDHRLADPDSVGLRTRFEPFEVAGEVTVSRRRQGDVTIVAYEYPLQCLAARCLGEEPAVPVELPPAVVSFVRLDAGRGVEARVAWPTARVLSRTGGAVMAVPAETSFGELPAPSHRIDPTTLRWLATGVAAAIVLALGAWIAWRARPGRREPAAEPDVVGPSSLASALARVRGARAAPDPDRRAALEALAAELDRRGGARLAAQARQLAWSHSLPNAEEIGALVEAVSRGAEGAA